MFISTMPRGDDLERTGTSDQAALVAFLVLQFVSLGGAIAILLTVIASPSTRKRHPTWYNFLISWMISCISYSILVGYPIGEQPNRQLCLAQAVLIYTVPTYTATTTTALVIHVLITVRSIMLSEYEKRHSRLCTAILVIAPYIPTVTMMVLSLVIGIMDPITVQRTGSGFYCNMENELPGKCSAIMTAVVMLSCLCIELFICYELRINWVIIHRTPRSISMIIRVLAFGLFGIMAVVLSMIFFVTDNHTPALNFVIALVPLAAILIFGSQYDILCLWGTLLQMLSCHRKEPPTTASRILSSVHTSQEVMLQSARTEQMGIAL